MLVASWLAYAASYFPRLAFSVAKLGLLRDPAAPLSRPAMGILDGLFLTVYAAGQFVWGAVGVRAGPRRIVPAGLALGALAALMMAGAHALPLFALAMLLQGVAQSTGWPVLCADVARRTPGRTRGMAVGILSTSYVFGGLVAPPALGWWAYRVFDSWRAAFLAGAAVALVVAGLYHRVSGRWARGGDGWAGDGRLDVGPMREALRDPSVQVLAAADVLAKPALYALLLWGPVIVAERLPERGPVVATLVSAAFSLAGLAGPVATGALSDRRADGRRRVSGLGLIACAALLLLFPLLAGTGQVLLIALGFFAVGLTFYGAESLLTGVAAAESGSGAGASATVGIVNGVGSAGAVLGGLLPGYVRGTALFVVLGVACLIAGLLLLAASHRAARLVRRTTATV